VRQEDHEFKASFSNLVKNEIKLKLRQKKGWEHSLNGRVLTRHIWGSGFNP
jgi:hypothetical protein